MRSTVLIFHLLVISALATDADNEHHRTKRTILDTNDITQNLPNLLQNPSFEEPFPDRKSGLRNPWVTGRNFVSERGKKYSQDGLYSMVISNRTSSQHGATQIVRGLKPGRGYAVSGYIKTLNDIPKVLWQRARVQLQFTFTDSPDNPEYVLMALNDTQEIPLEEQTTCIRSGEGQKQKALLKPDRSTVITYDLCYRGFITSGSWYSLAGDINAPMRAFSQNVVFRINGPDPGVDFVVDNLRLVEVPEHPDWMAEALQQTDLHRKTDFTLRFNLPDGVPPSEVDVDVQLKSLDFGVGAKMEDDCMRIDEGAEKYQDFVYNVFNWATVGSYKWKFDQGSVEDPDFTNAVEATAVLRAHGIKVRAHCLLWDVPDNVPDWVLNINDTAELQKAVDEHLQHMIDITKGKVEQWDVQNEMVNEHYYEDKLQNRTFTMDMFKRVRQLDRDVQLYLNDYQAITTGANVQELVSLARDFKKYGAEINGVGIQGHTKDYIKPDPQMIWHRLNQFAQVSGLDVFVTEFDLGHNDDVVRADWFEDTMRAFFAHPTLKGVILWGFWSERMRYENKYLTYGTGFKMSEVANRFACLVKQEWTTRHIFNLDQYPTLSVPLNGYYGDYDIVVYRKGVPVMVKHTTINKARTVDIGVTPRMDAVVVNTTTFMEGECISHRDQKSMGTVISPAGTAPSTCVMRQRWMTSVNDVSVTCEGDEVLTGCSSIVSFDDVDTALNARKGERISIVDGIPTCTAYFRPSLPADAKVAAVARCCSVPELTCEYRQAGPSLLFEDAMAEATCQQGLALGCAAYNDKSKLKGVVYMGDKPESCVGKSGAPFSVSPEDKSGVVTSAPCCHRSGMTCEVVRGVMSPWLAEVACPLPGQLMTSCAAEGESHRTTFKENDGVDICVSEGRYVNAIATCCTF